MSWERELTWPVVPARKNELGAGAHLAGGTAGEGPVPPLGHGRAYRPGYRPAYRRKGIIAPSNHARGAGTAAGTMAGGTAPAWAVVPPRMAGGTGLPSLPWKLLSRSATSTKEPIVSAQADQPNGQIPGSP
jgi:hypothetical protein